MTTPNDNSQAGQPLGLPLNDQLGLVVDAAVIDCWKVNYGLEKTPAEIAAMWGNWAPSGAILALRAAVTEIERLGHEAAFYRRRVQALEQWQSRMRDPERTVVCDILANGFTLDPPVPRNRYEVKT